MCVCLDISVLEYKTTLKAKAAASLAGCVSVGISSIVTYSRVQTRNRKAIMSKSGFD